MNLTFALFALPFAAVVLIGYAFRSDRGWAMFAGVLCILVAIGLVLAEAAERETKEHSDFMEQCTHDHKAYECAAMWRAGEDHTTVVPVVVPVPK